VDGQALLFAQDATALFRIAAVLPATTGTTYGRYSAGNNTGLTGTNPSAYASDTTVEDLISDASVLRGLVTSASDTVNASAASIDLSDITDLATDIVAMIDALLDCCADPADAIRILLNLIGTTLSGTSTTATSAVDMMIWQAAAAALTNAVSAYQPTSTDDAAARIAQIGPILDALSVSAADLDAQDVYTALRDSRAAIVASLRTAAATTADLTAFAFGQPLPALALAQQIYGDASRADQLVSQVDPINPLFFPLSFEALSA
jgi:prophage DNA circulation protein